MVRRASAVRLLWGSIAWGVLLVLLAACGRLITRPTPTPVPTPHVTPSPTPTPTPTPPDLTPKPYAPPTPTPTPTPRYALYIVQPGDTLLAIARRYGVDVQTLQDLNGIVDPRRLQVGQRLIVPLGMTEGPPTPTPTPLPLQVQGVYVAQAPGGDVWVLGEVVNTTDTPVESVQVEVTLLDAAGQETGRMEAAPALEILPPATRAPFAAHFTELAEAFNAYEVALRRALAGQLGSYYLDLEVFDVEGSAEGARLYFLRGSVRNVGPEAVTDLRVVATVYDALGRVVGFAESRLPVETLPSGEAASFQIEVHLLGGPVDKWHVIAVARRISSSP